MALCEIQKGKIDMRQIAIYGKGGVGKSTITQNLTAAFAEKGRRILLTGCDPKADSVRLIIGRFIPETVMELIAEYGDNIDKDMIVSRGFGDISVVESGGPRPGVGCAGRGITLALQIMEAAGVFDDEYDYAFYDVLGDVVCGGFAAPIRKAKEIYIVCSGELMALYAANNICMGIANYADDGDVRLGGIICNGKDISWEQELVSEFAEAIGTQMIGYIPKNIIMQKAELERKTVIEYAPDDEQADDFRQLAEKIENNKLLSVPNPLAKDNLEKLFEKYLRREW